METISHFLPAPSIVRFGPFEVDLRTGELRKRGVRIALQEQPLRILAALLEDPGAVVSREALCRRLWPQGTFVDFEHSLNAAVRRLRVTLGDQAGVPRFIETVPRRGYRFLAMGHAASPAPPAPGRARLAVMPFSVFASGAVESSDRWPDLFVEGLTAETITQLARACPANVGVIARMSVVRLAQDARGAAEIGRTLQADYLVEGSIRRDGDRVRIAAQLIDAGDETHLWAASYDRSATDSLTVQMEVAEAIARAVTAALGLEIREFAS